MILDAYCEKQANSSSSFLAPSPGAFFWPMELVAQMSKNGISKHYITLTNALLDLWGERLTHAQFRAMTLILNRTVRFDKWDEVIPRRHVMHGVPNFPTGPLGMSYKGWRNCVRALAGEGLIRYRGTEVGMAIIVTPQAILGGPLG